MTAGRTAPDNGEPDYRASLANERTMLAWQRTGLGMLAGAVAIVQLADDVPPALRAVLGLVLVVLGATVSGYGYRSWRERERRMRLGLPIAGGPMLPLLSAAVLVLAALVAVAVLVAA